MYLIHILLPLNDNEGRPFDRTLFRTIANELTKRFGGMLAHTRAPAEGLWKEHSQETQKDEIVILEVMAKKLKKKWWRDFRHELEDRFSQDEIVVRAQKILKL